MDKPRQFSFTDTEKEKLQHGDSPLEYYRNGDDSFIFSWGTNTDMQLGIGSKTDFIDYPTIIEELTGKFVIQVVCGRSFTIALTKSGELYSWGTGLHGQMGHGKELTVVKKPKLIQRLKYVYIRRIAASESHCMAISDIGRLYSWGRGDYGQLGYDKDVQYEPRIVKRFQNFMFAEIDCGAHFSLAVTEDGVLESFGKINSNLTHVNKVSCGAKHCAALSNGTLYTWGSSTDGRLGQGRGRDLLYPSKVENLEVEDVSCGFDHTVCLSYNGDIYVFGSNCVGQLGLPGEKYLRHPKKLGSLESCVKVFAGHQYTIAVTNLGDVYIWGRFTGVCSGITPVLLPFPSNEILNIGLGATHACAVFGKGGIFTFQRLFNNPMLSDFVFRVNQKEFFAHKTIVLSRCKSDYAQDLITSSNDHVVIVPNISSEIFELVLQYIYTDDIKVIDEDTARKLLVPSVEFGLDRLTCICESIIHNDEQPLIYKSTMVEDIQQIYRDSLYCDMQLKIRNKVINCHKVVLYCRTSYFQTMLQAGMKEVEGEMFIQQCSYNVFKKVVDSIYFTNDIDIDGSNVISTFMAAHRYRVTSLRQECEEFICQNLSDDIIYTVFQMSEYFDSDKLKSAALAFISSNKRSIEIVLADEGYNELSAGLRYLIEDLVKYSEITYYSKYEIEKEDAEAGEHDYYIMSKDPILYDDVDPDDDYEYEQYEYYQ